MSLAPFTKMMILHISLCEHRTVFVATPCKDSEYFSMFSFLTIIYTINMYLYVVYYSGVWMHTHISVNIFFLSYVCGGGGVLPLLASCSSCLYSVQTEVILEIIFDFCGCPSKHIHMLYIQNPILDFVD
jgi:hypothetical protein